MLGFLNAAMASATQRFMSFSEGAGNKENQKIIFNVSLIVHVFIALLVIVLLLIVGKYIFFNGTLNIPDDRMDAAKTVYACLIFSTIMTVVNVPYDAAMNAHENMKYYAVVGLIESFLKLLVALCCVYTSYDKLIVYGFLMSCIPLVTLSIMKIYCHRHYSECIINPTKYWSTGIFKKMISYAGWNFVGSAASILSSQGISIVINSFFGTIANAAQGVTNQISGQLGFVGSALLKSISPVITKSVGANNQQRMEKATIMGTKIIFSIISMIVVPVIVEAPFILKQWLVNPPEYSIIFCRLLFISNRFGDLVLFLPIAIGAFGKIKGMNLFSSILSFLPLLLAYLLYMNGAPAYSIYIITAFVKLMNGFMLIYFANKLCGILWSDYLKNVEFRLLTVFVVVLSLSFSITLVLDEGWIRLLIILFGSIMLYIGFQWLIGFTALERKYVIGIITDIKNKFQRKQ